MQRKTSILTFCYTLFLVMLFLSGSLTEIFSELVYYLAFILPIGISLYLTRLDGGDWKQYLTIDRGGVKRFVPLIFPIITAIIIVSVITSMVIYNLSGKTNDVDVGNSLIVALLTHALVPAVLEEMIFRYLPIRLLAPHSPRAAIIISAFFFSLAHADLFTIPYALVAGVMLMTVDLMCDSIVPSIVIHFINNALSVAMLFMEESPFSIMGMYVIIILLTVISIILVIENKEDYEDALLLATCKGEGTKLTLGMGLFAALTLTVAILNLL